jgi:hypothetical protein
MELQAKRRAQPQVAAAENRLDAAAIPVLFV